MGCPLCYFPIPGNRSIIIIGSSWQQCPIISHGTKGLNHQNMTYCYGKNTVSRFINLHWGYQLWCDKIIIDCIQSGIFNGIHIWMYIHTYIPYQYSTVQYTTVYHITLHCITLHYIAWHCMTLPDMTLHYITTPKLNDNDIYDWWDTPILDSFNKKNDD